MSLFSKVSSPTRRYVAMCDKVNFEGYYFKKFVLPEEYPNDTDQACWYFLNKLYLTAAIVGCITLENFQEVSVSFKQEFERIEQIVKENDETART